MPTISGKRIRQGRINKDLTIVEVAAQIGISPTALSYIEGNKNTASLPTLRKLSDILGLPISYLGCFEDLPERTLGELIRKARIYQGMQINETASLFCVDTKTITNWENDRRKPMNKKMNQIKQFIIILQTN
ncbi:helix-turn-helix domain-containing protein [Paenibacillus monticola]|nr:helix-turn-helix transcriptional regulator [Paenibacillus monticola]